MKKTLALAGMLEKLCIFAPSNKMKDTVMGKLWLTALLLLCLPSIIRSQEYRDVVFLKNGSVIKGLKNQTSAIRVNV